MFNSKLLRRTLAMIAALVLWTSSVVSILAEEEVPLLFLARDVYLNGLLVDNYDLANPFYIRDNRTCVPLTKEVGDILGFEARVDAQEKLILLEQTEAVKAWIPGDEGCNLAHRVGLTAYDYTVIASRQGALPDPAVLARKWRQALNPIIWSLAGLLKIPAFDQGEAAPDWELLKLSESEIFFVDGVPYIPLAAFTGSRLFRWSASFDSVGGLYISSDPDLAAASYYSHNNTSFIEGRAAYIRSVRPEMTLAESYYLEYLFRHEAKTFGLDQDLLMAVSRTESSFQKAIVAPFGSVGLMQIMPRTAAAHGVGYEELKDAHINLELAARFLRDRFWTFGGDPIKALSAYNQGVVIVSKGEHKTGFAQKCLDNEKVLKNWLNARGYSSVFYADLQAVEASQPLVGAETQSAQD